MKVKVYNYQIWAFNGFVPPFQSMDYTDTYESRAEAEKMAKKANKEQPIHKYRVVEFTAEV